MNCICDFKLVLSFFKLNGSSGITEDCIMERKLHLYAVGISTLRPWVDIDEHWKKKFKKGRVPGQSQKKSSQPVRETAIQQTNQPMDATIIKSWFSSVAVFCLTFADIYSSSDLIYRERKK